MTLTMLFPLAVAVLEFAAGAVYLWKGQPWLGLTWVAYGVACVGLAVAGK